MKSNDIIKNSSKGRLAIMKIQDYTKEMVDEKSFIDMAYTLLNDKGNDEFIRYHR